MERVHDNTPTIAENDKIQVKIYEGDGGEQHVHFIKRNGDDLKLSLVTLFVLRKTSFSLNEVDECQRWLDENMSYVKRKWSAMRRRHYD